MKSSLNPFFLRFDADYFFNIYVRFILWSANSIKIYYIYTFTTSQIFINIFITGSEYFF